MNNIEQRVQQVIIDHLEIAPDKVVPQAHFVEDLGTDSLDAMDLLVALNEEFDINIDAEQLEHINTVADFSNAVVKELAKK